MVNSYMINCQEELVCSIEEFVSYIPIARDDKILIKPNFVSLEGYPYTTDFFIIDMIINLIHEKGAGNITLADSPCPDQCMIYKNVDISIKEKAEAARSLHSRIRCTKDINSELEEYNKLYSHIQEYTKFFYENINSKHRFPNNIKFQDLFSLNIPEIESALNNTHYIKHIDLKYFDIIINLPVLKMHTTVGFTASVKNFYGILSPYTKLVLHKYKLVGDAIVFLSNYLSKFKVYTFLDARMIPDAQQMLWGQSNIKLNNQIIFGDDIVGVDKEALILLKANYLWKECKDKSYYNFLKLL